MPSTRKRVEKYLWFRNLVPVDFTILCMVVLLFLVSTYIVCERLSVMQQPARLPENFDKILAEHPCSAIWHRTPPPSKWKTLTFFPEFRSELTHNTPPGNEKLYLSFLSSDLSLHRTPPPENEKTLTFFSEFRSELTQNTPPPCGS